MKPSKKSKPKPSKQGSYVYIMSNDDRSMLYVGVTTSLAYRVEQHLKKVLPESFTARYDCKNLVYYKLYKYQDEAKAAERHLKELDHPGKIAMVTAMNPEWTDLMVDIDLL